MKVPNCFANGFRFFNSLDVFLKNDILDVQGNEVRGKCKSRASQFTHKG